jgi:hypothetical protein
LENALAGIEGRPAVNLYDNVDTSLPATTATQIDSTTITNGMRVLFTNLSAVTTTATFSSGANTITVNSASGLYVGMTVSDTSNPTYIPANTIITNIASNVLTISNNTTHANGGSSDNMSFSGNNYVWNAAVSGSSITWSAAYDNDRSSPAPETGDTILVVQGTTYSSADFYWNNSSWLQFNGATQVQPGNAISKSGNTLNVLYDNSTIGLNVSNQLYVLNAGITSTQLASNSVTSTKIATSAVGNGLTGGGGSAIAVQALTGGAITSASGGVSVNVDNSSIYINGSDNVAIKTGAYDQATITGGSGTAAAVAYAPSIKLTATYGGAATLSANTTYALRYGMPANSETASKLYVADWNTASYDLFWCVGLYNSSTATTTGTSITIVNSGLLTLGSSDTTFGSSDQGRPVYLGSSGAYQAYSTYNSNVASGDAATKLGIAVASNQIWVDVQAMGVN